MRRVAQSIIIILLTILLFLPALPAQAATWWDTDYTYRIKITFDNSACSENLTNWAVPITLNTTNFTFAHAQADGDDIRFIDSDDSTELSYYAETWDIGSKAIFWVKVPQIDASSVTDFLYVYFGNAVATNNESSTSVYASSVVVASTYKGSTATLLNDATSYANDGAFHASGEPAWTQLTSGLWVLDFDGVDDVIGITDANNQDLTTAITLECWLKLDQLPTTRGARSYVITKYDDDPGDPYLLWIEELANNLEFKLTDSNDSGLKYAWSVGGAATTAWMHIVETLSGTTMKIYKNGADTSAFQDAFVGPISTSTWDLALGAQYWAWAYGNTEGLIGLPKVRNVALTAEQAEASYNQQKGMFGVSSTYFTFGSEQDQSVLIPPAASSTGENILKLLLPLTIAMGLIITALGIWQGDPLMALIGLATGIIGFIFVKALLTLL